MNRNVRRPVRFLSHLALGVVSTVLVWIAALPCPVQAEDHCPGPQTLLHGDGIPADCIIATASDLNLPDIVPGGFKPPLDRVVLDHIPAVPRSPAPVVQRIRPDEDPPPHRLRLHLRNSVLLT